MDLYLTYTNNRIATLSIHPSDGDLRCVYPGCLLNLHIAAHRARLLAGCSSPSGGPNQVWREAAAHQWVGRRARKERGLAGRPRLKGMDVKSYAALAFLAAVGFACFGWAFAAVFLTACAFSFAANSALTFWVIASVSTL